MKRNCCRVIRLGILITLAILGSDSAETAQGSSGSPGRVNQVLEWNQIFVDTLIATNTANSSSQRLGAIVHTAIFDAYNGIDQRYTPIFVHSTAPKGASRRAAVIAAAYTALGGPLPIPAVSARCELCGVARRPERRLRAQGTTPRKTALVRNTYRARHRLGN
jgi:hypothetical protein